MLKVRWPRRVFHFNSKLTSTADFHCRLPFYISDFQSTMCYVDHTAHAHYLVLYIVLCVRGCLLCVRGSLLPKCDFAYDSANSCCTAPFEDCCWLQRKTSRQWWSRLSTLSGARVEPWRRYVQLWITWSVRVSVSNGSLWFSVRNPVIHNHIVLILIIHSLEEVHWNSSIEEY